MKKIIFHSFIAFSMFQTFGMNAQLTVKGGSSFVYVGDELLFVTQDVNLEDGKIYLRRSGELLQATSTKPNDGNDGTEASFLSSYIMSKPTNQYSYTHYGLPVRTPRDHTFKIDASSLGGVSSDLTSTAISYVGGSQGVASQGGGVSLLSRFVSWYDAGVNNEYSGWRYPITNPADNAIPKGYGLYMKGTDGLDTFTPTGETAENKAGGSAPQRFEFRGVPNSGDIAVPVNSGELLYALGNPYPSAMDLNEFIENNKDVIEGVYFYMETDKNSHNLTAYNYGYGKYTPIAGGITGTIQRPINFYKANNDGEVISTDPVTNPVTNPVSSILPIGTGFWIVTKATFTNGATQVVFRNRQRMYSKGKQLIELGAQGYSRTSKEEIKDYGFYPEILNLRGIDYTKVSKEPAPLLSIVANDGTGVSFVAAVFSDTEIAKDEAHLYKTPASKTEGKFNVYISEPDGAYKLVTTKIDASKPIPITIESPKENTVYLDLDNLVNFKKVSDQIYIYDDYTGEYKNIKESRVSFTVPAGKSEGRYFITFSKGNENAVDEIVNNTSFVVLQNNIDRALTINNPEALNVTSAEMFDIQGRLVLAKKNLGSEPEYRFSTSSFADGIYIVKITTQTGKPISKKVIVKN